MQTVQQGSDVTFVCTAKSKVRAPWRHARGWGLESLHCAVGSASRGGPAGEGRGFCLGQEVLPGTKENCCLLGQGRGGQ